MISASDLCYTEILQVVDILFVCSLLRSYGLREGSADYRTNSVDNGDQILGPFTNLDKVMAFQASSDGRPIY